MAAARGPLGFGSGSGPCGVNCRWLAARVGIMIALRFALTLDVQTAPVLAAPGRAVTFLDPLTTR